MSRSQSTTRWALPYCALFRSFLLNCCYNFLVFPVTWIRKVRNGTTRNNACAELIFFLFQLYILYWIACIVHTETYVFQCTQLGSFLRPVRRTRCLLVPHTLSEFNGDGRKRRKQLLPSNLRPLNQGDTIISKTGVNSLNTGNSGTNSDTNGNGKTRKKLSIALVYLYDGSKTGGNGNDGGESWSEPLMQRVIQNRQDYCRRHGYTMINANSMVDRTRPAAWSKLTAMDSILDRRVEGMDNGHTLKGNRHILKDSKNTVNNSNDSNNNNNSNIISKSTDSNSESGSNTYNTYDYLMYIDMDVVIMDLDRRLEDFIEAANTHNPIEGDNHNTGGNTNEGNTNKGDNHNPSGEDNSSVVRVGPEFLMTEDWKGPNTGTWFVQNVQDSMPPIPFSSSSSSSSPPSFPSSSTPPSPSYFSSSYSTPSDSFPHWFLRTAWAQAHLLLKKSPLGVTHPFEYEQRAFHFLLDTEVWRDRGLQRFRSHLTIEAIRSHFLFFPQCSFNAYSLHPLDFRGDREISQFIPGDFLIHFAGKKGRKKLLLMEHYLGISEKNYKKK